jgi:hypothetical protein
MNSVLTCLFAFGLLWGLNAIISLRGEQLLVQNCEYATQSEVCLVLFQDNHLVGKRNYVEVALVCELLSLTTKGFKGFLEWRSYLALKTS